MVSLDYIRRSAKRNAAHTVARAFLRALGLDPAKYTARSWEADAYAGLRSCMANHGSPMDGRR